MFSLLKAQELTKENLNYSNTKAVMWHYRYRAGQITSTRRDTRMSCGVGFDETPGQA